MALVELQHDLTVVHADGRAVHEGQVIDDGGQADVVQHQAEIIGRDDRADAIFYRRKVLAGLLDAGPWRRADMKLDQPAIDGREEI